MEKCSCGRKKKKRKIKNKRHWKALDARIGECVCNSTVAVPLPLRKQRMVKFMLVCAVASALSPES